VRGSLRERYGAIPERRNDKGAYRVVHDFSAPCKDVLKFGESRCPVSQWVLCPVVGDVLRVEPLPLALSEATVRPK
jgi:hypothetical protein